jgi:hypothetical protein
MEYKKLIPNSTQLPNILLDHLFPFLSESELRAVLYIARRTYGFQKEKDGIGLGQFTDGITKADGTIMDHGAGIKRTTAIRTLKILDKAGIINVKRAKMGEKGRKENIYSLNLDADFEKVIPLLQELRGASKWVANPSLFNQTSATKRPSATNGPSTSTTSDTSTSATKRPHKTKSKPSTKQSIYAPGAHRRLIQFFHDTTLKARGFKPDIGATDGAQLKRVLELEAIPEETLEKFMLYFLASSSFMTFTPSLSTMLSAGVLNGLRNRILNDPKFYKELDHLAERFYPKKALPNTVRNQSAPFERKPVEVSDEWTPSQMKPLGDHISALISRLGLVAPTSG